MTNSLNTPIEALEYAYPFRVRSYGYRKHSGGSGQFRGGDGIIREIEMLTAAQVTLICERQKFPPYGLAGGLPGKPGIALLLDPENVDPASRSVALPSKCSIQTLKGNVIQLETPGGGGWGVSR
jgi:N-methylhydantoinase B